ncbi:hypothetical protein BC834DRAFT_690326 [Gloeopeniophorella convolvens]|nr:hypothetical protein BC834DRAFT_690326 [Gloeopeniophorella convolvens]
MSPPLRHDYSLPLAAEPCTLSRQCSSSNNAAFNPFGPNATLSSDSIRERDARSDFAAPTDQSLAPFAMPSRPDFVHGFGLDTRGGRGRRRAAAGEWRARAGGGGPCARRGVGHRNGRHGRHSIWCLMWTQTQRRMRTRTPTSTWRTPRSTARPPHRAGFTRTSTFLPTPAATANRAP